MTLPTSIVRNLASDLRDLGVREGGVLLVHASLRSLGLPPGMESRAEGAIRGLLDALGPEGTLLMPALSYESTGARNPLFDVCATPSCVGALTEYFRTRPGTLRSVHPTHSVCGTGPRVEELLGTHINDETPVGPNSPFSKLPHVGGQVLFLGCGMRPNTSMHGIEEHIIPPYLFGGNVHYRIILPGGGETSMKVRSHNFAGWEQRYDRLEALMPAGLTRGMVLDAACYLLDAPLMWQAALAQMRLDPLYFVDRTGGDPAGHEQEA